jgi:hypothetical protein
MVALYWLENRLLTYWFMSDVFPTLTVSDFSLCSCRSLLWASSTGGNDRHCHVQGPVSTPTTSLHPLMRSRRAGYLHSRYDTDSLRDNTYPESPRMIT